MTKVRDKRMDGSGVISISGKESCEKAAEGSEENDGFQEVLFHLAAARREETGEGRNKSLACLCPRSRLLRSLPLRVLLFTAARSGHVNRALRIIYGRKAGDMEKTLAGSRHLCRINIRQGTCACLRMFKIDFIYLDQIYMGNAMIDMIAFLSNCLIHTQVCLPIFMGPSTMTSINLSINLFA